MAEAEVVKLQNHLRLLREEYVKLQSKHAELEKKYQVTVAATGQASGDSFIARLLTTIADLFDKELYSDLTIYLDGQQLHGHRFVLAARSDHWGVPDLGAVTELDLTGISHEVSYALVKWAYTDQIDIKSDDTFLLDLLKTASNFKLAILKNRCEQALMSSISVKNCIRYYQTAEEIGAELLKKHCSELISNHWNDFTTEDFACMPAPLLYSMFKTKTQYPLHTAIRTQREDVVFLYLIEFDSLLPGKLNEVDNRGDLPLDLALQAKQESIAQTLVGHKVDVSNTDNSGKCLLHKAIRRGDEFSASFLIKNGANVNATSHVEKETALHMVASFNVDVTSPDTLAGMARIAKQLLEAGANSSAQDTAGNTPIHRAVLSKNEAVFSTLLSHGNLKLELQNADGFTVLWLGLQDSAGQTIDDHSFAARLIKAGSSPDAVNPETGDCLLHLTARAEMEAAALFLVKHGAKLTLTNSKGETPLHTAAQKGLAELAALLLDQGANPNSQTTANLDISMATLGFEEESPAVTKQTPLHIAILNKHVSVVKVLLDHKDQATRSTNNTVIIPNFNIKDSRGHTALGLSLWNGFNDIAVQLLNGGANINEKDEENMTLLHQAIMNQDVPSCLFLLENKADISAKTADNESPLQLAIKRHLPVVVDALCSRGIDMNIMDSEGNCPLWQALETGQEDVASILVRHGCDTNMWGPGPDGCQQTLLHRAIDENNEAVACFLIRSMCDVNESRRLGPNGEGGEEARDGQTPLHLAATWGQERVVQCLIEHNAVINAQDSEGKSPIHVAINNQHTVIISLLLSHPGINLAARDRQGQTPFAAAMTTKNNKAAQAILDREPRAAEQLDNRGRNFLHVAITKSDIESVLFLISVHADVNSKVQDSHQYTPLQLAVMAASEIIVRNLILAGANVNELSPSKQTALHLSAENDQATSICSVLLENGIDCDALDAGMNNALHIAVQHGNLNVCRVLLTESRINAEAVNMKGQMPMHVLGQYGRENAAAIFDLFLECMPEYPIDRPDVEGNTVLLLAYLNGNGNLCRAIVRAGAMMGNVNRQGMSIFNAPVATKQLLFKLLDMLAKEPPWTDGDNCEECAAKFGIKTRKHHCRHCGRLLCNKCSDKDIPIIKYNQPKPVRVCQLCFDVLTLGGEM